MTLDVIVTTISVVIGLYAGWRMLRRSIRYVYDAVVSSIFGDDATSYVAPRQSAGGTVLVPDRFEQPVRDAVPPLPYQAKTSTAEAMAEDREPIAVSHNMDRVALITLLAVQKDDTGDYVWSANKIADFIGGTRAETLKIIADLRPKAPPPPAPASIRRPANGWH